MPHFEHLRHQPPTPLERPRELVLALPPMRSGVNLARLVRLAGSLALEKIVACGPAKVDREIARDALDHVTIEWRRSLPPVLKKLKAEGYELVGLEQTTHSECLYAFPFKRRTVLVVGNEREGLDEEHLALLDRVAEIPVYGLPHSHNAATAATMAIYEYCRQFPAG